MTLKLQRNEEAVQEREQEIQKDTAKKCDKSKGEAALSALNRRFLESLVLEGLDEVKSNLIELDKVNREGLTNLELKLNESLSSLHREFETLKRQVDEAVVAGVAVRWKGLTNFTIEPMDVFEIILGLNIQYEVIAFISPRLNQLHISDAGGSYVVPLIRVPQNGMHLSAIPLSEESKTQLSQ
uniref:Uncharacterized protein n=1 Tax=Solanum tuberosum TaxID=4113 RepID=M1DXF3_SOLTU